MCLALLKRKKKTLYLLLKITTVQSECWYEQRTHLSICSKQIPVPALTETVPRINSTSIMHRLSLSPSFGCGSGGQNQNRELNLSPSAPKAVQEQSQQQERSGILKPLHMGKWKADKNTNHNCRIKGNTGMREKVNYKVFYLNKSQNFLGILHLKNQLRAWSKTKGFFRRVLQLQITSNLT